MAYSDVIQQTQGIEQVQHGNSNNAAQIYVYDVNVLLVKYSLEPQMPNSIHKFHSRVIGTAGAVFSQAYS